MELPRYSIRKIKARSTIKNSRLRGTAVSDLFFFVYFCFLALVQVFYSRATPIIMRHNACVNDFFHKSSFLWKTCG